MSRFRGRFINAVYVDLGCNMRWSRFFGPSEGQIKREKVYSDVEIVPSSPGCMAPLSDARLPRGPSNDSGRFRSDMTKSPLPAMNRLFATGGLGSAAGPKRSGGAAQRLDPKPPVAYPSLPGLDLMPPPSPDELPAGSAHPAPNEDASRCRIPSTPRSPAPHRIRPPVHAGTPLRTSSTATIVR